MTELVPPIERIPQERSGWLALIASLNVRPSKGMGQNFLFDRATVERIVGASGVEPGDRVIEVGPGLGVLTAQLLSAGAVVDAIELDRQLAHYVQKVFGDLPRFTLHEADALQFDVDDLAGLDSYRVVANLPYSIAAAVIMHFLEQALPPERMTVMVQKEVAERFAARPPHMTILSVTTQILAETEFAFTVPPSVFIPQPKVESAVVNFMPLGQRTVAAERRPLLFKLVNAGFRHKRKQIANSLAFEIELPKEEIIYRLASAGIDPLRRAQTLDIDEWVALLDTWERGAPAS
jgi:16S rRNA (adenine1518-N6/adenine1519-N6)-dimethyltransferase